MAQTIRFQRKFAEWGAELRDFERGPEVLQLLQDVATDLEQVFGIAYIGGKITSVWLHEGDAPGDTADLDLIFTNEDDGFLDILLREDSGLTYGGALDPSETVEVLDDLVDGHRVIIGTAADGTRIRYEASSGRYFPVGPAAASALKNPARAKMRRMAPRT